MYCKRKTINDRAGVILYHHSFAIIAVCPEVLLLVSLVLVLFLALISNKLVKLVIYRVLKVNVVNYGTKISNYK